jgi:hypothetical protein
MKALKHKIRTFRCSEDLDDLLRKAAQSVDTDASRLLRDFVQQGSETILRDQILRRELRRKYSLV